MQEKFYFDTSICIDICEGKIFNDEIAKELVEKIINSNIISCSDRNDDYKNVLQEYFLKENINYGQLIKKGRKLVDKTKRIICKEVFII